MIKAAALIIVSMTNVRQAQQSLGATQVIVTGVMTPCFLGSSIVRRYSITIRLLGYPLASQLRCYCPLGDSLVKLLPVISNRYANYTELGEKTTRYNERGTRLL